ncbi:hypothetical protein, partial [Klebsiella pneumoniae]
AETPAGQLPAEPIRDPQEVEKILLPEAVANAEAANFKAESEIFKKELKVRISGFGGQGILSLGLNIANMGRLRNFNVSWMPSYGP